MSFALRIMSKRIWRDQAMFRFRGWSANWMDTIVAQDRVDAIGRGFEQVFEERPVRFPVSFVGQLSDRELAGAVDTDEQIERNHPGSISIKRSELK